MLGKEHPGQADEQGALTSAKAVPGGDVNEHEHPSKGNLPPPTVHRQQPGSRSLPRLSINSTINQDGLTG